MALFDFTIQRVLSIMERNKVWLNEVDKRERERERMLPHASRYINVLTEQVLPSCLPTSLCTDTLKHWQSTQSYHVLSRTHRMYLQCYWIVSSPYLQGLTYQDFLTDVYNDLQVAGHTLPMALQIIIDVIFIEIFAIKRSFCMMTYL